MDQFLRSKFFNKRLDSINTNKLIKEDQTLLLIIDIQEKLIKSIYEDKLLIFNLKKLIKTCNLLNVNIAITEQNPLKLGKTINAITNDKEYKKFEKLEFSCGKNEDFLNYLNQFNFQNIIICGIESHICVLQTSIELLEKGFNILIPKDAIGSRKSIDKETAFLRLILAGAIPSTTESIICELCKTSNRKEFREISNILKDSFSN